MSMQSASRVGALRIDGERTTGQDVRTQNITACIAVANVVRSSLGPVGLDKMMVDDIGDVTISNDGATILKLLEIEHPAARLLVDASAAQDEEIGDGTTSVVLVAAELLKRANELAKNKIHPTNIIAGFRLASKEAVRFIKEMAVSTDTLGRESIVNAAKTSMSSKIIGTETEFFADIVVRAIESVRIDLPGGKSAYPVKAINILKQHGRSARESELVPGFALNCTRASQAMPKAVENAKIALLDFDLQKARMKMGVQILIKDPKKLEEVRKREFDITKERIQKILASGANVILTTRGIDDTSMKYMVEAGVIGVRRVTKDDMRRIAKLTGGRIMTTLADEEGGESFSEEALGEAKCVVEERVGDSECVFIREPKTARAQSIVLRGANSFMLDEMHRSIHDSLCAVRRTLESRRVVPGGGCVEAALSVYLERFSRSLGSREQLAIAEFAEALLVIPKTLAVNAALDATDLVSALCAYHYAAQNKPEKAGYKMYGLDVFAGKIVNNLERGVLEPALSKIKSIQLAAEAATSILRIDDFININAKPDEGRR
nr:T-complex protein 1 subunit alpha [Seculamonas ecuadoriensis]